MVDWGMIGSAAGSVLGGVVGEMVDPFGGGVVGAMVAGLVFNGGGAAVGETLGDVFGNHESVGDAVAHGVGSFSTAGAMGAFGGGAAVGLTPLTKGLTSALISGGTRSRSERKRGWPARQRASGVEHQYRQRE